MAKSNSPSPSDDSTLNVSDDVRRRVTKACQRCRLKKCKCDGSSPCGRCKADDAICVYGKHKKSDKTVYRKGYVQMLERQHSQLIAGVHEMYRLQRQGFGWPHALIELANNEDSDHQPLTHQILEALGVLQTSPQDDVEDPNREWQIFEHHPPDDGVVVADHFTTPSPTIQNLTSAAAPIESITKQPAMHPRSTSLQQQQQPQQRSKIESEAKAYGSYNSAIPPRNFLTSHGKPGTSFSSNMAYLMQQQQQQQPLSKPFYSSAAYDDSLGLGLDNASMCLDWTGLDDPFDISSNSSVSGGSLFMQPVRTA